ncbi:MAG: hypothetical protein [Wendovervirus sonii]|uniref:Exonuclease n=1 Tax=phage Lak_Megaphage_Sonny TaxID=3109229 RepID=A0ABZ0Z2E4_9CAUD|nr:MAG: hypothetical protein [phage Lak_Megaphage_Sonny]
MERYTIYLLDLETFNVYNEKHTNDYEDAKDIAINMLLNNQFDSDADWTDDAVITAIDDAEKINTRDWQTAAFGLLPYEEVRNIANQDFNGYIQIDKNYNSKQLYESIMSGIYNALNEEFSEGTKKRRPRITRIAPDVENTNKLSFSTSKPTIGRLFNEDTDVLSMEQKNTIIQAFRLKIYKDNNYPINIVTNMQYIYNNFRYAVKEMGFINNLNRINKDIIMSYLNLTDYTLFLKDFRKCFHYIQSTKLWKEHHLDDYIILKTIDQIKAEKMEAERIKQLEIERKYAEQREQKQIEHNQKIIEAITKNKEFKKQAEAEYIKIDTQLCDDNCEQFIISELDYETLQYYSLCDFENDGYMYKVCRPCRPSNQIESNGENMNAQAMVYKITKELANSNSENAITSSIRKSYIEHLPETLEDNSELINYYYVSAISLYAYLKKYTDGDALTNKANKDYIWNKFTRNYIEGYVEYINN